MNKICERLKLAIPKGERKQLSQDIGVSPNTITNYLNGYTAPKYETLLKIAKARDIDIEWLLGEKDTGGPGDPAVVAEASRNYIDKKEVRSTIVEKMDTIVTFLEETYGDLPAMLDDCLNQMKNDLRKTNPDFRQWEYDQQDKLLTRRKKLPEQGDNDPRIHKQKTANGS